MPFYSNSGWRKLLSKGSSVLPKNALVYQAPGGGDPPDPGSGPWYDAVFAKRSGDVGPRVSTFTPVATFAANTAGVNLSSTQCTITASDLVVTGVDFGDYRLRVTGANVVIEDCIGNVSTNVSGNNRYWDMAGLNPTVRYCRIANPYKLGGKIMLAFHDATGTATEHNNLFLDAAGQDPLKGPNNAVLVSRDSYYYGVYLTSGAHIDMIDMRQALPGSEIRRHLVVCDTTPGSVPSSTGTGVNNAIRQNPGDFSPAYVGTDYTVEECIFVGHDDPLAQATFFSISNSSSTGIRFYDVLVDLREHNNLVTAGMRVDDWYVRYFDYAASVAAGQVTGISAPVPFPNLANQPATVPSTMAAPVITAVPGGIQWLDCPRPANQRDLITQYDVRYSTDGTNWTTVADVPRTSHTITVPAGSNYRIQIRAVNGIGTAAWSPSSNLVDVAAPSGTHRVVLVYGQSEPERMLNAFGDGAPKPALLADNRVRIIYHNPDAPDPRPVINKWMVGTDSSLTGGMIAFANTLIAQGGPLDTWEVGFVTYTGEGWGQMFNDGGTKMSWPYANEIFAQLSAPPVVQYQTWLSSNRTLAYGYARAFENLWLGTDNGVAITAPHAVLNSSGTGTQFTANHLMPEVYSPAASIPVLGQHKFDVRQDQDSWETLVGGGTDFTSRNIHRCRVSIDGFSHWQSAKRGAELCSYINGYDNGSGGWTDIPHPNGTDPDGVQRFAAHMAYAICEALGLAPAQPEITSVTWTPQKVIISSSAGPITNVFAERGEPQLGSTFPHWTQAMGFYINDQPAQRAEIVNGNIELYYGDGTQNFINTDTIMFLPGGAGATLKVPEDFQNAIWKAIPHVNIGIHGDGLMNLRPMVNFMALFPNTLVNTTR